MAVFHCLTLACKLFFVQCKLVVKVVTNFNSCRISAQRPSQRKRLFRLLNNLALLRLRLPSLDSESNFRCFLTWSNAICTTDDPTSFQFSEWASPTNQLQPNLSKPATTTRVGRQLISTLKRIRVRQFGRSPAALWPVLCAIRRTRKKVLNFVFLLSLVLL